MLSIIRSRKLALGLCGISLSTLASTTLATTTIEGIWKQAHRPIWYKIMFNSDVGTATIKSSDIKQVAKGQNIITNIVTTSSDSARWLGQWSGDLYSTELGEYVKVKLVLADDKTLIIYDYSTLNNGAKVLRMIRE